MRLENDDPLPAGIWLAELRRLANDTDIAEDRAVRRAFHLRRLSPPAIARLSEFTLSEEEMELMLEEGRAYEAASLIVDAHGTACPDFNENIPALDMINAWANSMADPQ